jgi:hypothetical protein
MRLICGALVLSSVVLGASARSTDVADAVPNVPPAVDLPVVRQHTYRMAGKVRMLLIWVGREDVGVGVIKWKAAGEDKAYELLIGSDPAKAPGRLNKWGYLVEEIRGDEASVVGVISQDNEDRLSDVKQGLASHRTGRPFDTVRGRVGEAEAHARVGTLYAPSGFTLREAPALLRLVLDDRSKPVTRLERPAGVRAGFLTSLTELITRSISAAQAGKRSSPHTVLYVHGDRLYELRLLDSIPLARHQQDGRNFEDVIRGRFETARAGDRSGTGFELIYGASGPLAGVPIMVSYQPKWWLQVDLFLQT